MNKRTLFIAAAITGIALSPALPAWEEEPRAAPAEAGAEADGNEEASVPETLRHKDRAVSVMEQPLDGSSMESFTAGLDRISEEGSEEDYRNVMSALDFLLFYDIGARRKKDLLYARLDGMTPNQILERVSSHRAKPAKPSATEKK